MQETSLSKDDARITRIVIEDEKPSARYGFEPDNDERKAFFSLCSAIRQCGEAARLNQSHIHRSRKEDREECLVPVNDPKLLKDSFSVMWILSKNHRRNRFVKI